ncbi:ribonuclease domain-containing protein [Anaerococcus porci]|uniref:ribonuclease domain-containing protein n=1 Tax=Anaerococcus porci TaxID=2652269 RepID=UPI002A75BE31|nr:ribonuclease domain-containing protein [Anaerococcus porci]MDY3005591.1 ribonuclease domain-containing protein [Anaerococcus porci]
MRIKNFLLKFLFAFSVIFLLTGCVDSSTTKISNESTISEDKAYYKKYDVIAYLKEYEKLPPNYLTKKEARKLGRIPKEGNLWEVTDKGVIGGDYFGNFEKNLPEGDYKECDVNYNGGKRGPERLVFDEDFNIYYTNDHYNSFSKEN